MSRAAIVGLALLVSGVAAASPRVEIALRDGSQVSGELLAFEGRAFLVQLDDGSKREIGERGVRVVRFLGRVAPTTLEGMLGQALQDARRSGALERDVLGERYYKLRESRQFVERFSDESRGTKTRVREAALRVVASEHEGGLLLEVERRPLGFALPTPSEGPARMRCWVDAAGRVTRWTLNTAVDAAELRVSDQGYSLQGEGRWYGATRWAASAGAFPRDLVRFVCLPLAADALPARFELAAWDEAGPRDGALACERLPGADFRGGELVSEARLLEEGWETSVWLGADEGGDRRVRGWRQRKVGGVPLVRSGEAIDAATFAELIAGEGVLPAPPDAPSALPALAPELAALLAGEASGERILAWSDGVEQAKWGAKLTLRWAGSGLECEVLRHGQSYNQATTRCVWTRRGLAGLYVHYPTSNRVLEAVFTPRAGAWSCLRDANVGWRGEHERVEVVACPAPPAEAVPRELSTFLLSEPALTFAEDRWLLGSVACRPWEPRSRPRTIELAALRAWLEEPGPKRSFNAWSQIKQALLALRDAHAQNPGGDIAALAAAAGIEGLNDLDAPLLLTSGEGEAWTAQARGRLPGVSSPAQGIGVEGQPQGLDTWLGKAP